MPYANFVDIGMDDPIKFDGSGFVRSDLHDLAKRPTPVRSFLERLSEFVLPISVNRALIDLVAALEVSASRLSNRVLATVVVQLDLLLGEITGPFPRRARCKSALDALHGSVAPIGDASACLVGPIETLRRELLD